MFKNLDITQPFAIICQWKDATLYRGKISKLNLLKEIKDKSVNVIPYSQIKEKGYEYWGEELPIMSLKIESEETFSKKELENLPSEAIELTHDPIPKFTDEEHAERVKEVIKNEIYNWEGPNFNVSRQYYSSIKYFNVYKAIQLFKDLVILEENSYMTFIVSTWEQFFVWASPELHLLVKDGKAQMNPISWTIAKKNIDQLDDFLNDQKEIYELFHNVDEELKMMSVICSKWWEIVGPVLKEMNSVIHTEYYLIWECCMSITDALRTSLLACTVVGAPIENACRIVKKYEKDDRRYYSSVIAIKDKDFLDSSILIRTVEIQPNWEFILQVGWSIVEYSDPMKEAEETNAKAWGMIRALKWEVTPFKSTLPKVPEEKLQKRNEFLSHFLLAKQSKEVYFHKKKAVLINNRDDFIITLWHMLNNLWIQTTIVNRADYTIGDEDLVVIWPWPWNPNEMPELLSFTSKLLNSWKKIIWICLWHQMIAKSLGLSVERKEKITQWVMEEIYFFDFWWKYKAGFYNSFSAKPCDELKWYELSVSNNQVNWIRWENLYSVQFHPESIFSEKWFKLLELMVIKLL